MGYKPVSELTFADDFMFGAIMRDADICAKVIERLLKIRVSRVDYPELQKAIHPYYTQKGVRLDVYVADSERVFDIEIQTYRIANIGRRTRYYQAMLDIDSLLKGAEYSELRESYVIFLCTFDPFGLGLPVYTFNRKCEEDERADLDDGTQHKIFNCAAFANEKDEALRAFLDFVQNNRADDALTKEIETMVTTKKFENTFVNEYMAWNLHDRDVREQGIKQGIKQGKAEGVKQGIAQTVVNFVKAGVSFDLISKATGLTEEEIRALQ